MSAQELEVSVVIPFYRGEAFIAGAIASVLSQEGGRVEVIVVDDGSPGIPAAAIDGIADPRVRVLRHDGNLGIAAARNTGLAAARAELIAFLDQDDRWVPGRLAAQLRAFEADRSGEVGLITCGVLVEDARGRVRAQRLRVPRNLPDLAGVPLLRCIVADNFVRLGAALIRRRYLEQVGAFNESIRGGSDDFDMITRLAGVCRFDYLPQLLFVRTLHADNYTRANRMIEESLQVIDRAERQQPTVARAARIGRSRRYCLRAREAHVAGESQRAAADYRRSLASWPWQRRAWMGLALCVLGPVGEWVSRRWSRLRGIFP